MKLRIRLILLLFILFLLFLTAFIVSRNFDRKTLVMLFKNEAVEKENIFDKLLRLKSKSLETLAVDYTYWDEMTSFIQSGDMEWAKANIDTCLATYDSNVVWIYKLNLSLAYSINNIKNSSLKEIPIPKEVIEKKLFAEGNRFCHFFMNTENGLLEIRGSTIHSTNDSERKTSPHGYFFTGRLWDQKYITELSELSNNTITLDAIAPIASDPLKGKISFQRKLLNHNNTEIKILTVTSASNIIDDFNNRSKKYFFALTIFIIIIIGIFSVFTIKWVGIPVYLISKTLRKEDTKYISNLENTTTEFGDIARLIKKFFTQKLALINEINERKKVEKALRTSKECFDNIVARSAEGIIILNMDMTVRFLNPAAESFLGNKDLLGKTFNFLISLNEISEIDIHRKNNELGIGEMRTAKTIWEAAPAYLITIQDITNQKTIQKNQRLAQLGKLAADMAHEINNPLMIISGNAQLTLLEQINNPGIKNSLELIYQQSLRAKDIVQIMLKFSHPGKEERKKENVTPLINEVVALLIHQFKLNNIEIKTNLINNPPPVMINPHQMQEVFINLLNNAKDALAYGGTIEITTFQKNNFLCVNFMDTGCGIEEKNLEKIFEPFFTTKSHGTGLGLSLCYSIIKSHGGEIIITSKIGKGTTVSIQLPIMEDKRNA